MSTVYTLNGKVLKNAANDKWLTKKEAPAGFVMNASNVVGTSSGGYAGWAGPANPNAYDGNGKTIQLTVSETIGRNGLGAIPVFYASGPTGGGPQAAAFETTNGFIQPGTYTLQMAQNPAPGAGYGTYLSIFAQDAELLADTLPKITLTILDP